MLQILETGKALYVLAAICGLGILTRLITGRLYKRLLKESTNLAMTKNKRLKELRQRAENTYRMNQGLRDSGAWLEHQLYELRFMGITLAGWSTLSMQWTWLCLLAGAAGAFASYWYRLDTFYIVLYGGGAVMMAMLTMLFDLGAASGRKEQLLSSLQDYLENVMCPRLARNLPLDGSRDLLEGERGKRGPRSLLRGGRENRFGSRNESHVDGIPSGLNRSGLERVGVACAGADRAEMNRTGRTGAGIDGTRQDRTGMAGAEIDETGLDRAAMEQNEIDRNGLNRNETGRSSRERNGIGRTGTDGMGMDRAAAGTAAAISSDSVVNGGRSGGTQSGRKLTGRAARRAAEAAAAAARAEANTGPNDTPDSRGEVDYLKRSLEQIAASREKSRASDENWLKDLGPEEVQLIGDILKQYLV